MAKHVYTSKRNEGESFARFFLSYSLESQNVKAFITEYVTAEWEAGNGIDVHGFYSGIESVCESANSKSALTFLLFIEGILADAAEHAFIVANAFSESVTA